MQSIGGDFEETPSSHTKMTRLQHFSPKRGCEAPICSSVENIGFEPITSSLPAKRSSQMS